MSWSKISLTEYRYTLAIIFPITQRLHAAEPRDLIAPYIPYPSVLGVEGGHSFGVECAKHTWLPASRGILLTPQSLGTGSTRTLLLWGKCAMRLMQYSSKLNGGEMKMH